MDHSFQLTLVIEQVLLTRNTFLVCGSPTIAQWAEGIACTSNCAGSLNFFLVGVPLVSRVLLHKKKTTLNHKLMCGGHLLHSLLLSHIRNRVDLRGGVIEGCDD